MAKKQALGKGLDALMRDPATVVSKSDASSSAEGRKKTVDSAKGASAEGSAVTIAEVEVALIDANPFQPRTEFDEAELANLAESIQKLGIIQPLTVRRVGDRYQLISGERRLRAAKLAGMLTVPAYVREAEDQGMIEMALVENIQRSDLNAIEIAITFQRLLEECNLSQEELSPRVGKNRATISNYMRLLKLPLEVQLAIRERKISMGHARALLAVPTEEQQIALMRRIEEEQLSVRQVEDLSRKAAKEKPVPEEEETSVAEPQEYASGMQRELEEMLGWGVSVKPGPRGAGRVIISYRSEGERLELMQKLGRIKG